jgi:transcriptional regulator with XRE-family HTH domain
MSTQFALDLRLARRKAGYTQKDIAHLLSSHQSLVSDFEHGRRQPNLEQIIELSLIYGRSFESFFAAMMSSCQINLHKRLERLPSLRKPTAETYNRANSIKRLKRRLANPPPHEDA